MKLIPLLAAVLLISGPATGMPHPGKTSGKSTLCLDRSAMVDLLIDEYGEQLAEVHPTPAGLLEFHVSDDDGTWTAILTDEDGVSCVLAFGDGIEPAAISPVNSDEGNI